MHYYILQMVIVQNEYLLRSNFIDIMGSHAEVTISNILPFVLWVPFNDKYAKVFS